MVFVAVAGLLNTIQTGANTALNMKDGAKIPPLRLHSNGSVAVYFEYMLHKPVFGDIVRRQDLLDRLNKVPGVRLPPDAVSKRKTIPLKGFTPEATSAFLAVMDWFVTALRQASPSQVATIADQPER